ncbi:oligodendrocyte-myelin glycoprotein [Scyliorhinus canicula]|uniref:oligodendrocyte-myelin glycoprotein n=1 Tax=Scyliorhinus canicula TaxID=7830 RepID=UPI0018F4D972|nr:oligodendrocyte-myelin glycoprotein [Scyliorhinus canicula]
MDCFTLSSCFLALLCILPSNTATCPSGCSCKHNDRYVDCSGKGLTELPENIQDNIISLNISNNGIKDLGDKLKTFINLRYLNMSNNLLTHMPTEFPRALWEIYAASNRIKILKKEDTATQWNLRILDVSNNLIERAFLINNTLNSLTFLNFSGNRFWTVPTNMPYNLETLDLSHNNLLNIIPDTFHQGGLSKLYLNNNSFTFIPNGTFDQLINLRLITLYGNLWECNSRNSLFYLLTWIKMVTATVLGHPCIEKSEANTFQSLASQETGTSSLLHSVTSASLNSPVSSSVRESLSSQETGTSSLLHLVTSASLNSPAPSSVREPLLSQETRTSSLLQLVTSASLNSPVSSSVRESLSSQETGTSSLLQLVTSASLNSPVSSSVRESLSSQETGTSSLLQLVTSASLNSPVSSSVRESLSSQETGTSSLLQLVTSASLNSPASSSVREPLTHLITQNISIQTMGSTESSSNPPSANTNATHGPSSSTMPTATLESTSSSTVSTKSMMITNKLNGTVNSQTSGSMSWSTFEPMSTTRHRPTESTAFSKISESSLANATTSHAAMKSITNTIKTIPTSLTAVPKINGITGTTSRVKQSVTTAQSTNSKAHVGTGITLDIMVLTMLVPLVV